MSQGRKTHSLVPKACNRCGGDLFYEPEDDVFACLQCGRGASWEIVRQTAPRILAVAAGYDGGPRRPLVA